MSDIFKHYPQPENYIPNNYPKYHAPQQLEIMAGETALHTFEVPMNVDEAVIDYQIIYKLGITPLFYKDKSETTCEYDEEHHRSIISCSLTPAETRAFANTVLDAKVQIKFLMVGGTTAYTEVYQIKLSNGLDAENHYPTPVIGNMGYTED